MRRRHRAESGGSSTGRFAAARATGPRPLTCTPQVRRAIVCCYRINDAPKSPASDPAGAVRGGQTTSERSQSWTCRASRVAGCLMPCPCTVRSYEMQAIVCDRWNVSAGCVLGGCPRLQAEMPRVSPAAPRLGGRGPARNRYVSILTTALHSSRGGGRPTESTGKEERNEQRRRGADGAISGARRPMRRKIGFAGGCISTGKKWCRMKQHKESKGGNAAPRGRGRSSCARPPAALPAGAVRPARAGPSRRPCLRTCGGRLSQLHPSTLQSRAWCRAATRRRAPRCPASSSS